jgi:hypothetical protein
MGYFNPVVGAFASLLSSKTAARYKGLSKPSTDTTPQGAWCATGALTLWLHILASFIACSVGVTEAPHSQTNYPREGKALVWPQNVPGI